VCGPARATTRAIFLAIVLAAVWSETLSAKRKDDRLVMANGDSLTGEIKKLERGELYFKGDYMLSSMQVDWRQVLEIESRDDFQVILTNGRRVTGLIVRRPDGSFTITPHDGSDPVSAVWSEIVGFLPVETNFWRQLTGNIDSGFSYASGDSQTQFSASGTLVYPGDGYSLALSGSSTFSGQADGSNTSRNTVQVQNQFSLGQKWYVAGLAELLNSEQQDLNLRTTLGGALGRWFRRTDKVSLTGIAGLVYTHENYSTPPDPSQPGSQVADNIEGVIGLDFSFFNFKTAEIVSRLTIYPSLTTAGRVRLSYAPTLNLEIAHNLYWSFTLYENYDSNPPVNANKNDFGVTNSFGWKF
jgi:putative salt-induced outer membrane protein YdiY